MGTQSYQTAPILVSEDGPDIIMERVVLGSSFDGGRREDFIQKLVFDHPSALPMLDIEPAFTPLISICRELPTSAGYLDNLWVTPEAGIVLGECKLVRNPQSRREVVAQALDYAQAIKGWHFSDLEEAVAKSQGPVAASLWDAVSAHSRLNEAQFVDAVERRLRTGRFMILIIGDGIREGVEDLTSFLQLHAGLHTGLALVDLSIWKDASGRMIVVPRVPMKTLLIERGIVRIDDSGQATVEAPTDTKPIARPHAFSASEPEFFDRLDQSVPGASQKLKAFLSEVSMVGVEPEFRKSLVLRFYPSPDGPASAGYVEVNGKFHAGDGWWAANKLGRVEAGQRYLENLAKLIGGSLRGYGPDRAPFLLGRDGTGATIADLLKKLPEWADVTRELVTVLSEASRIE